MNIGLFFREQLNAVSTFIAEELDQIIAVVRSTWQEEHNEDGTHGAVTASGSVTSTGDGSFDGDVTARASEATETVRIGVVTPSSVALEAPGIQIRPEQGWTIQSKVSALSGPRDSLHFYDTRDYPTDEILRLEGDGTNYFLKPGTVVNAAAPIFLGRDASGERWAEVIGLIMRANTAYYERGRSTPVGEWTSVTYAAGNFTAATGNWTVDSADQVTLAYTLVGKTMTVAFEIENTDVSAGTTELRIAIPGSFTAAKQMTNSILTNNVGTLGTGIAWVEAGGTVIKLRRYTTSLASWTATSADNTGVRGQITFEVQ